MIFWSGGLEGSGAVVVVVCGASTGRVDAVDVDGEGGLGSDFAGEVFSSFDVGAGSSAAARVGSSFTELWSALTFDSGIFACSMMLLGCS